LVNIHNYYISRFSLLVIGIDSLLLFIAYFIGVQQSSFYWQIPSVDALEEMFPGAVIFILAMILSMAIMGMYLTNLRRNFNTTLSRLMPSVVLCFGILIFIFYIFPQIYLGRGALLVILALAFFEILIFRSFFYKWFNADMLKPSALVLGAGKNANELFFQDEKFSEYQQHRFVGFVQYPEEECHIPETLRIAEKLPLYALVQKYKADEIIIASQERRGGTFPIQELLECKMRGVRVIDIATFFERERGYIRMDSLYPSWLVFGGGFDQSVVRTLVKRVFDMLTSSILLVATFPVMLITALLIILEDGFPIFYRQERVGKNGEVFTVLKFRSMLKNAEKDKKPQWAATDDPRITRVGNIIRKLRIDELPQIVNVLKNEMSFVGPRPERPYFVNMLAIQIPYYNVRHSIKPGITGWAQVRYPYGSSIEDAIEKLQYDLYYVKNHSLFLDVVILILTVEVVLMRRGSR